MGLQIPLPSRFVNAVIFFVVDVLGLWAIHRCLRTLQCFYLHHLARGGRFISIARSRIPIFSGELLKSATWLGSTFVLANFVAILLAFFATLGVNGETVRKWEPVPRTNVTSLTGGVEDWNRTNSIVSVFSTCSTRNDTHFGFWPVAFNAVYHEQPDGFPGLPLALNATCQKEAPDVQPLVMAECIKFGSTPCNIYDIQPHFQMNATLSPFRNWSRLVAEFEFTTTSASSFDPRFNEYYNFVTRRKGFGFVFGEPLPEKSGRNKALLLLSSSSQTYYDIILGELSSNSKQFGQFDLIRPVRITPASVLNNSENINFLHFIRNEEVFPRYEPPDSNMPSLVDFLFSDVFSGRPNDQQAYTEKMREVTFVYDLANVLYCILFAVLLLLFFIKELLISCVIRQNKTPAEEVFASEFDRISRTLRRKMEVEHDMAYSGDHALLGLNIDDRGVSSVTPVASATESQFGNM